VGLPILWPIRLPARIQGFHPCEVGAAPTWATIYGDIVYVWKGQDVLNIKSSVRLPSIATNLLHTDKALARSSKDDKSNLNVKQGWVARGDAVINFE
jgi:hypothetical protein